MDNSTTYFLFYEYLASTRRIVDGTREEEWLKDCFEFRTYGRWFNYNNIVKYATKNLPLGDIRNIRLYKAEEIDLT